MKFELPQKSVEKSTETKKLPEGALDLAADWVSSHSPIWIKRSSGAWVKGTAQKFVFPEKINVVWADDDKPKQKAVTIEQLIAWQKEQGVDVETLQDKAKEKTDEFLEKWKSKPVKIHHPNGNWVIGWFEGMPNRASGRVFMGWHGPGEDPTIGISKEEFLKWQEYKGPIEKPSETN